MSTGFRGWNNVARRLRNQVTTAPPEMLTGGQRSALSAIADRLPKNGVLIADDVGLGKTRIATSVARAVVEAGGRVAVIIPPGLNFQWQAEFREVGQTDVPQVLRSYWRYLEAWSPENDAGAWFRCPVLLVSHGFTNWHLGSRSRTWRWELLRIMRAIWLGLPRRDDEDPRVAQAASSICHHLDGQARRFGEDSIAQIKADLNTHRPKRDYEDPESYQSGGPLRALLERAVGLGLGRFDLILIDEAHKGRGEKSKLSGLLDLLWTAPDVRRIALTATPVELDEEDWDDVLARIEVPKDNRDKIRLIISDYMAAVKSLVPVWRTDAQARERYKIASRAYKKAMSPYLLRRDKRSDRTVQTFAARTGKSPDAYRHMSPVLIKLETLTSEWRQAIRAAEALSFVADGRDDPASKRLRLTFANGHGIADLLDAPMSDADLDKAQTESDAAVGEKVPPIDPASSVDVPMGLSAEHARAWLDKRNARNNWWRCRLKMALGGGAADLFGHPSILAAVETIESSVEAGQKVLVFGRFTRPMRALVDLLNARAMLRALDEGTPWPQAGLPEPTSEDEERAPLRAVRVAWQQLHPGRPLDEAELNDRLAAQYKPQENARRRMRPHVFKWIDKNLCASEKKCASDKPLRALLQAAQKEMDSSTVTEIVHALSALMARPDKPDEYQCTQAFRELANSVLANDDPFDDAGDHDDEAPRLRADARWNDLKKLIKEEFSRTRGGFARLLNGATPHETRRLLQAAFNRRESFPRVLVAQSVVGREGLNLQAACRVVVLLHPEWNPGVVEQQIGRVDRLKSRWQQDFEDWAAQTADAGDATEPPRIEIRPIIFKGTYDEHNWEILKTRWDSLRAQLHGLVVPSRERENATAEERQIIDELDNAAPNFSPGTQRRREQT